MLVHLLENAPNIRRRTIRRGTMLYAQGEAATTIYVILTGQVSMGMLNSDGQEVLIDIVGTGVICGEGAAFDGMPHFSTACALEDSEVLAVPVHQLREMMLENKEFFSMVMSTIAMKQRMLATRLAQGAHPSADARITQLLAQISQAEGPTVKLTHQQIGNLIGASRVTVTRAVQRLRRCGSIYYERGQYKVIDPARANRRPST